MSSHKQLRIGLIGAGRIGRLHAENIALRIPEAALVAVADVSLPNARECGERFGIRKISEDYRAILSDSDVEAVVICSSTDTHSRIIGEAADAGKHIFCEKPIDFDLARIDAALTCVEQAGIKLQIGFNRRFDGNFSRVQKAVASGEIGIPHLLRITSRDPAPPPLEYIKVSGGLFLDMTIHDFDMARFLVGSEVKSVYAQGAVLVDPGIGKAGDIDTAIVTLEFENGELGSIDNSRRAVYGYDQRVEVFGSEGNIQADNNTQDRTLLSNCNGVHGALPLYFFLERYRESYVAELQAFVKCVREDGAPPVSGADGRAPVVIGLAAQKSLREKRPVLVKEIG